MSVVATQHTGLHVADRERSLAFYRDLLGFEVVWERVTDAEYVQRLVGCPGAELRQTMLRVAGSEHQLELIDYRNIEREPVHAGPPHPGTAHICLVVRDLRALHARVTAAGIGSVSNPVVVPHGPNEGRVAVYLVDPDGFRIELLQLEPEDGDR